MLTRLPRTVALTTRRTMATYRKVREPYDLKKKPRTGLNSPSHPQTKPRRYAPVDSTTSFGLRAPEKEPWKPDDDRFDTSIAREVDKPIGGVLRQHLVVRPGKKDGDSSVAGPETSAPPEPHSQGSSPIQDTMTPSLFLIVRNTTATIQDMHRALHGWGPLEIHEVAQQFGSRDVFVKFETGEKAADAHRYHQSRELFYGVKVQFEFGTEEEFRAIKDLNNEVTPDGTPLHGTPRLSQTQAPEFPPSTPTQTLESLIPKRQPFKFFNDDSGKFPRIRRRLPDGTYEGQAPCIFLGNVPIELLMDKRDIWKRFEGFGEIRDIRIPVIKPTNAPKGFCYIRYVRVEDAVKLYESLMKEPLMVQGRMIRCDFDGENPSLIKTMDGQPSTCLMLDHLLMDMLRRPDSIYRAMLAYGDVQDVRLARSGQNTIPSGPVYVEYSSIEEAKAAERALNSGELASQLGGTQVVARFAAELRQLPFAGNDVPCRTLYLGRVPSKVLLLKRSLLQPFEKYGPVVDLRIPMEDGWPKGYCYIEYTKLSDAVTAFEDLHTTNQLMFYGKPLYVSYASPRGERSRIIPESVGRFSGGSSNRTDRMRLLEEHLDTPLDRSRMGDSPRHGGAATADGTAPSGHSPKVSLREPWARYGFKGNS